MLYIQSNRFTSALSRLDVPGQLLVAVLIVGCIEWLGWFAPIRSTAEKLVLPGVARSAKLLKEVQIPFYVFTTRGVRLEDYRALQQQYAQVLVQLSKLESVQAENQVLRQALESRLAEQNNTFLVAPILTADGTFIGVGSADGVSPGALVLATGVLVGRVQTLTAHQARIQPVQQFSQDAPLLVKTESGAIGLVYGTGKQIKLQEVSRDQSLEEGDRVLTAGQEGVQAGILVGTVREVENRHSALTLSAVLNQPVSLYEVAVVEVW